MHTNCPSERFVKVYEDGPQIFSPKLGYDHAQADVDEACLPMAALSVFSGPIWAGELSQIWVAG